MKLTLHTFLTLDGVMQGPGAAAEDPSGGFERGGWLVPFVDEGFGEVVGGWFEHADAFLFGRTTYELMRGYWPQVDDPDDIAGVKLNALPKYVVSGTMGDPGWNESTVLSGDVIEEVTRLKQRPGRELQIHGSCLLARTLHAAGLIDEYRLFVFPVSVGQGKRLFTDDAPPTGFTLLHSRSTAAGVVYSALAPAPFAVGTVEVTDGRSTARQA